MQRQVPASCAERQQTSDQAVSTAFKLHRLVEAGASGVYKAELDSFPVEEFGKRFNAHAYAMFQRVDADHGREAEFARSPVPGQGSIDLLTLLVVIVYHQAGVALDGQRQHEETHDYRRQRDCDQKPYPGMLSPVSRMLCQCLHDLVPRSDKARFLGNA